MKKEEDKKQEQNLKDLQYPSKEDIYNEEEKEPLDEEITGDEPSLDSDLDVPGSELDDADEKIGEEDEENNYYSLGGDDHNDLDEKEE